MHYNIYFNDRRFSIASHAVAMDDYIISRAETPSHEEIRQLLEYHRGITFLSPEPESSMVSFSEQFKAITAAGGLVQNSDGEYLMILRASRWDLPKGHWEPGESLEECALREVEEETGVGSLTIGPKICCTYHTYSIYGTWELKCTHWYKMSSEHVDQLIPQTEEGIERVEWCTKETVLERIVDSYPTIREIFNSAL